MNTQQQKIRQQIAQLREDAAFAEVDGMVNLAANLRRQAMELLYSTPWNVPVGG